MQKKKANKMTLEESISTEPVKEKLRELNKCMHGEQTIVYAFGNFLADRLGDKKICPETFSLKAELALYDLEGGVDGRTGEKIDSDLVRYRPIIYDLLRLCIPAIASAVCPENFAESVKEVRRKIQKNLHKLAEERKRSQEYKKPQPL